MSEEVLIWIMGICIILVAAAMATQAAAGFQLLRIIKPLLRQSRQLIHESKRLVELTETVVGDAKPRLVTTGGKARDFAKATAERASERKRGIEEIFEPLGRLRKSSRAKPRRIRTHPGSPAGVQ